MNNQPVIPKIPINVLKNRTSHNTFISDRNVTRQALHGITKITPFFHRIKLSSSLGYDDIDDIFPDSIKQPGNSGDIASRKTGKKYQKMGWLWLPSIGNSTRQRIAINYNPIDPFCPKSQFNIINPTVETLAYLDMQTKDHSGNPTLKLSSVEYTIDFHCKTPTDVGNLFYIYRRNFYCSHAKSTSVAGGNFTGYSHEQDYSIDRDTNSVFFIDFSAKHNGKPSKRIKFYERGPDKYKRENEQFWSHDKCDRVRYEATITTDLLRKKKIKHIKDFLTNPNFYELLFPSGNAQGLFQFKQFIDKQYRKYIPPTCDQDYYHKVGEKLIFECFLDEVIHARNQDLDLSNSLENYPKLDVLVNQVKDNVRKFEEKWKRKGLLAIKNMPSIEITKDQEEPETLPIDNNPSSGKPDKMRLKDFYEKYGGGPA